jgi:nucleotide-binding universal stress UspA family protein
MFSHILVASDLTLATRRSLRAALDLARPGESQVLLFHVIRKIPNLEDAEVRDFYERLDRTARRTMVDLSQVLARERGVEIRLDVAVGDPATEIVRVASERNADLIVLLHHSEDEAPAFGSTSYKVGILAPCSVLLLKGREDGPA